MISNENIVNNKVVKHINIYNFYFGHLSILLCLKNLKFEFQNIRTSNGILGY